MKYWIYLIFFIIIWTIQVQASAPLPSPNCIIEGSIHSVRFEEASKDTCIKPWNNYIDCPVWSIELHKPARYYLEISVKKVSYAHWDETFRSCETLFPLEVNSHFRINAYQMPISMKKIKNPFNIWDTITWEVENHFADVFIFKDYVLNNTANEISIIDVYGPKLAFSYQQLLSTYGEKMIEKIDDIVISKTTNQLEKILENLSSARKKDTYKKFSTIIDYFEAKIYLN